MKIKRLKEFSLFCLLIGGIFLKGQCTGTVGGILDTDDFDGDGVCNIDDLDDDNDGILDTDEGLTCTDASDPQVIDLSQITNDATAESLNYTYQAKVFINGVYKDLTVTSSFVDVSSGDYAKGDVNGNLRLGGNPNNSLNIGEADLIRITFSEPVYVEVQAQSGGTEAFDGQSSVNDVGDIARVSTGGGLTLTDPDNQLIVSNTTADLIDFSPVANINFASTTGTWKMKTNQRVTVINYRLDGNPTGILRFLVAEQFCTVSDLDLDGIPNHQDLDSDDDGCADAMEGDAGLTYSDLNGDMSINASVNDNGIPIATGVGTVGAGTTGQGDVSSKDDTIVSAECDFDGDGIIDFIDIDDDNDGILDVVESPNCFYTEEEALTLLSLTTDVSYPVSEQEEFEVLTAGGSLSGFNFSNAQAVNGGGYFTMEFPTAVELSSIDVIMLNTSSFLNSGNNTTTTNTQVILQGSNDGTTWTDLSSSIVYDRVATGNKESFTVTQNSDKYLYYRIAGDTSVPTSNTYSIGTVNALQFNLSTYEQHLHPKIECINDTDEDTEYNHLDLDSDGDGCSDSYESGAISTETTDNQFISIAGTVTDSNSDGLADVVDSDLDGMPDYIMLNYAYSEKLNLCEDSDKEGVNNIDDLDDDNDGILDSEECPLDMTVQNSGTETLYWKNWQVTSIGNTSDVFYTNSHHLNNGGMDPLTTGDFPLNTGTPFQEDNAYGQTGTGRVNDNFGNFATLEGYVLMPCGAKTIEVRAHRDGGAYEVYSTLHLSLEGTNVSTEASNMVKVSSLKTNAGGTAILEETTYIVDNKNTGKWARFGLAISDGRLAFGASFEWKIDGGAWVDVPVSHVSDLSSVPMGEFCCDLDGDGVINSLDLDSDGDGCPDTKESDILSATGSPVLEAGDVINGDGTTNTTVSTGDALVAAPYGANGFADTLETSEDGIFTGIYTYSNALDALVSNCFCLIDGATGVGATSDVGMSTLKRLKVLDPVSNWPHNIANGHLVLESKDKGLVLTRIANPETAITNPIEGMMVYDMDDRCLKLYDGTTWGCIEQTCPD